jgi:hypothetical protein
MADSTPPKHTQPAARPATSSADFTKLLHHLKDVIYTMAAEARANRISRSDAATLRLRVRELFQLAEWVDPKGNNLLLVEVPVGLLNTGWQAVKSTLQADAKQISDLEAQIAGEPGTLTPIQQSAIGLITDQDDVNAANEIVAEAQAANPGSGGTTNQPPTGP